MSFVYKMILLFANIIAIFWFSNGSAIAHEFWIEPKKYKLSKGDILSASLFVGQDFSGYENPYLEDHFVRFEVLSRDDKQRVNGRIGDRPALNLIPQHDGLNVIIYQSTPSFLTYNNFEKFINFTEEKGFAEIPKQHVFNNLPKEGFAERYTRYSKSYVSVLNSKGSDKFSGMRLEWVLQNKDLLTNKVKGLSFMLYYEGNSYPNSLVTVFAKNNKGEVQKSISKTDDNGIFQIMPNSNMSYLIDSVVIQKIESSSNTEGAIWESLWASATFKIE